MKLEFLPALLVLFLLSVMAGVALADVDEYMGDTAIYSAQGTTGFKPNVLIIIDNSAATQHIASGVPYNSAKLYGNVGYNPWDVYVGDNQGAFSRVEVSNSSSALGNLTCKVTGTSTGVVYNSLILNGTYSGSGTAAYPNLNGGACLTAPKGATYALGNYLNYVNATRNTADDVVVTHDYTYQQKIKGTWTNITESRKFLLIGTHVADAADTAPADKVNEPIVGSGWEAYWQMLPDGDTHEATPWTPGTSYSVAATFAGDTQRQIVYDALENVLGGARYAVNFAAMTYGTNNHGGKIINEMSNLEDDDVFQDFLEKLPGSGHADSEPVLSSLTGRPQAEALYDAGYYFGATYSPISVTGRIPASIKKACYNNIIFVTNGLSNGDGGSASTIWQIGDADEDGWPGEAEHGEAVYGEGSHYLDDVAQYLQNTYDITTHMVLAFQGADPLVQSAAISGDGKFYNVYDANTLSKAMTELLTNIVAEVNSAFVAPVVPTSPENRTYSGERVYLGFFKPISQKPWQGNLKKFGINGSNQIVDSNYNVATLSNGNFDSNSVSWWNDVQDSGLVDQGGVGKVLYDRTAARKIYTYNNTHSSKILTDTEHGFTTTNSWLTFSALGVADDAEKNKLINFIHGLDAYDDNGNSDTTEKRPWIMGDILHSKPKIVNYNTYNFSDANESAVSGGVCTYNKTVIFVGANDGMLHAFRDCDGEELWAFVPPDILGNLKELRQAGHRIFVDGTPAAYIYDADDDGNIEPNSPDNDKVILLFGLRRGGDTYYALDVSNPDVPKFLWKIDSSTAGFEELGQSWSTPVLGKVKYKDEFSDKVKIVAFIGAGYDNANEDGRFGNTQGFTNAPVVIPTNDAGPLAKTSTGSEVLTTGEELSTSPQKGRGVYAFEVADLSSTGVPTIPSSPVKIWDFTFVDSASADSSTLDYNRQRLNYAIPSDVAAVDTDYDGFIDRLYVGDTGGRIWRICAYRPSNYSVATEKYRPYARAIINTTDPWFGKIIFDANTAPTANSSDKGRKIFYKPSVTFEKGNTLGVYFGTGDRAHPLNTAVTDRMYGLIDRGQITSETIDEDDMVDVTDNCLQASSDTCVDSTLQSLTDPSKYGWYIKLENDGEKVLASPLAFNKVAYYTTYAPLVTNANSCTPGNLGVSRLYAVDYKTGEAVLNFYDNDGQDTDANTRARSKQGKVLRKEDRSVTLGVGIPSGIVVLMPPSGDAELLIGCGGGLCSEDPVLGGTIIPIYWMAW